MEVCLWDPALVDVDDPLLGLVHLEHLLSVEITENPVALAVTLERYPLYLAPRESELLFHDKLYLGVCNGEPSFLIHQALNLLH